MFTSDKQILKLPAILIQRGIIEKQSQFFDDVGISKSFFSQVKNQEKYKQSYHFTPEQIERIALFYSIDLNWIFDLTEEPFVQKRVKIRVKSMEKQ